VDESQSIGWELASTGPGRDSGRLLARILPIFDQTVEGGSSRRPPVSGRIGRIKSEGTVQATIRTAILAAIRLPDVDRIGRFSKIPLHLFKLRMSTGFSRSTATEKETPVSNPSLKLIKQVFS